MEGRLESRELLYAAQKDHPAYPRSAGRAHREQFKGERRERRSSPRRFMPVISIVAALSTVNNALSFTARHISFVSLLFLSRIRMFAKRRKKTRDRERERNVEILLIWKFSVSRYGGCLEHRNESRDVNNSGFNSILIRAPDSK